MEGHGQAHGDAGDEDHVVSGVRAVGPDHDATAEAGVPVQAVGLVQDVLLIQVVGVEADVRGQIAAAVAVALVVLAPAVAVAPEAQPEVKGVAAALQFTWTLVIQSMHSCAVIPYRPSYATVMKLVRSISSIQLHPPRGILVYKGFLASQ